MSSLACPQRHGRRGPYIQGQAPSAGPKPRVVLEALRGAKTVNGLGSPVGAACRDEASRWLQYFWRGLSGLIGRTLLTCGFAAGVRAVASRAVKKLQPSGVCVVGGGRRWAAERPLGAHQPPAARPPNYCPVAGLSSRHRFLRSEGLQRRARTRRRVNGRDSGVKSGSVMPGARIGSATTARSPKGIPRTRPTTLRSARARARTDTPPRKGPSMPTQSAPPRGARSFPGTGATSATDGTSQAAFSARASRLEAELLMGQRFCKTGLFRI